MQQGKKYQCPECPYATHQRSALQMHLNIHPRQRLCCPYCPYRSDQIKTLTKHLKSHKELHTPEEPNMPENGAKEDSARNYSNDAANELKDPEDLDQIYPKDATNEMEDPLDLYVSKKKSEDLDHSNEVNSNLKKPTCSKENSLPSVESSAVASPSSSKRPCMRQKTIHRCPVPGCPYSTDQACNLKRHNLKHTKEKPFSCFHCAKKCAQKDELRLHYARYHEELPIPEELQVRPRGVHACNKCGERFTRKDLLEGHERRHHPAVMYPCVVCGRNFKQERTCLNHYKYHLLKTFSAQFS